MFADRLAALGLPEKTQKALMDPARVGDELAALPVDLARNLHACCHITMSPNLMTAGDKVNTIANRAEIQVDVRLLPGDTQDGIDRTFREIIGPDLLPSCEIEQVLPEREDGAAFSSTDTPLWQALTDSIQMAYPNAAVVPSLVSGGTDARFFRKRGIPAYGAGLLSSDLQLPEFLNRFHGHNERIDINSLELTTQLWLDVLDRLWV
jgi:acetylornithine deacetylase/succinyl-diaminopimelate desuccinylase-like protein